MKSRPRIRPGDLIAEAVAGLVARPARVLLTVLGTVIGVLIAENEYAGEIFKPILFDVFSVPKSIFLPMFILVFGVGFAQKVGFGFFSTIFIVIMSTTTAVESVKEACQAVGLSFA